MLSAELARLAGALASSASADAVAGAGPARPRARLGLQKQNVGPTGRLDRAMDACALRMAQLAGHAGGARTRARGLQAAQQLLDARGQVHKVGEEGQPVLRLDRLRQAHGAAAVVPRDRGHLRAQGRCRVRARKPTSGSPAERRCRYKARAAAPARQPAVAWRARGSRARPPTVSAHSHARGRALATVR